MIQDIITYFVNNGQTYLTYVGQHLSLSIEALVLACVLALPLAYFSYEKPWVQQVSTLLTQGLRVIPSLGILFILIPFIGVGRLPALIALVILGIPPILLQTIIGFESVSDTLVKTALGRSIKGKTAELFWLACKEGAYFGGCDVQTVRLAGRIGRNIGFAFQIYDDILDYTADQDKLKKPVLEDLGQGIYTLPLLLAKQQNPEALIPYLCKQSAITPDEITEVAKLVVQLGGVEQAKQMAQAFTQKALIDIKKLPNSPAKDCIQQLTLQLLQRQY
ncbi:polyprenyl synthetase family protein [Streptococcus alactolyticus]|uniref:polyprenyl synthetase family protein n=2 Tax=Streptococcus TaxID=1301 RepID=UPI001EF52E4B|nr:polyprenyl synthetase family protein [Streptococcus alactolyticus]